MATTRRKREQEPLPEIEVWALARIRKQLKAIAPDPNRPQEWLAREIGVSPAMASKLLKGRRRLTLYYLESISRALDDRPDNLIKPDGEYQPPDVERSRAFAQLRGRMRDRATAHVDEDVQDLDAVLRQQIAAAEARIRGLAKLGAQVQSEPPPSPDGPTSASD